MSINLTKNTIIFSLLSALLFSNCLPSTDTDPYEGGLEMWEEPRHQLVFSKDNIKVMDVVIPAGDTCLFHVHRHPTIYVLLNGTKYAGQTMINTGNGVPNVEKSSRPVNSSYFRENRFEVAANQQSDLIQLEYPAVLVQYTDGLTSILEKGVEHSFKTEQGGYSYHAANTPFQITNKSSEEQKFVAIELK